MKKLEDIPKKEVFKVPDGYFDNLPTVIQSRVAKEDKQRSFLPSFQAVWRYALPLVVLLGVGIFWFTRSGGSSNPELILASVQTEDLVAYLSESEISTDEVLDVAEFNSEDLDAIEEEVYELHLDSFNEEEMLDEMENNL